MERSHYMSSNVSVSGLIREERLNVLFSDVTNEFIKMKILFIVLVLMAMNFFSDQDPMNNANIRKDLD